MTIRDRTEAFQGAEIVLVTDSLGGTGFDSYPGWTKLLPSLLAAKDPNAKVILRTLTPNAGSLLIPDITVQAGSTPPSQTIRIVRDAASGEGAVSRWASQSYLFAWPADYCAIALGANDAGLIGTAGHSCDHFMNALYNLANKARTAPCSASVDQITLVTAAWYENGFGDTFSVNCAAIAAATRYVARKHGFNCIDVRQLMEDHYTGTGNAGQGSWFPTDNSHFGPDPHAWIAQEHMRLMGWP